MSNGKITKIVALREDLDKQYYELRTGKIERKDAVEPNNTAGKVLGAIKVELENAKQRGEKPDIDYLNKKVVAVESDTQGT